jgi:hypothetical protein
MWSVGACECLAAFGSSNSHDEWQNGRVTARLLFLGSRLSSHFLASNLRNKADQSLCFESVGRFYRPEPLSFSIRRPACRPLGSKKIRRASPAPARAKPAADP